MQLRLHGAKALNAEGIRSPQPGTKKKYNSWAPSAIREMLRRDLYVGRKIWDKTKKVKAPGTNKRVRRQRPETEWKILEIPELRIVADEGWYRVQARLAFTVTTSRTEGLYVGMVPGGGVEPP